MKLLLAGLIAFILALAPGVALAADGEDDDVSIRINGDVTVAAGETIDSVFVINGNATIEGTVTNVVVVIDGNAVVSGSIGDGIVVISGDIDLQDGATVNDVTSIRGDFNRASGATVTGHIEERDEFFFLGWAGAIFGILFWAAITVGMVAASLVFAAIGGSQLTRAAVAMTGEAASTIVGFVFVWVALPILAIVLLITLIGIPLGISLLVFVLPTLWFLGYLVAGTRLGGFILWRSGREPGAHPYAAAGIGVLLLQLGILVPIIGGIVAGLAGLWGAGALAFVAFRAAGGRGIASGPAPGTAEV